MNCGSFREHLDDYLDGLLPREAAGEADRHVAHCPECSRRLQEARDLQAALESMPVPPPSGDLMERALQARARKTRTYRQAGVLAAAASLLIAVAAGWMVLDRRPEPLGDARLVEVTRGQPEKVNLVFNSARRLEGVKLTVEMPEGVELAGYPNRRKLSWRTTLESGRNVLELPVILRSGEERTLAARLEHGQSQRQFRLRLRPSDGTGNTGFLSPPGRPAA